MNELSPLSLSVRGVNQGDLNGSPGHDIGASWQKVSANDGFQDATFAGGLASNNNDLGQIDVEGHLGPEKDFLKLANQWD